MKVAFTSICWESKELLFHLRTRLLLLLLVQRQKRHARHLHNFETNSWDISDGVARATESRHQHLTVLDQLHTNALTDGRVRLLGLHTNLLKHNALGMGGSGERVGLAGGSTVLLLVLLVVPFLTRRRVISLRAARIPLGLPEPIVGDISPC